MGGSSTFVLDANLGLTVGEAPWVGFLAAAGIVAEPSTDLAAIDGELARHGADLGFVPAADYHRFADDPAYRGLAIATSSRTGEPVQSSVLVVRADDPATSTADLDGATLGYVNTSCSSSWFAPALLTRRYDRRVAEFFTPVLVPPWQPQIDAVVAGRTRATTVLEDVWAANPGNAATTRIVDRVEGLAPPVVVARDTVDDDLAAAVVDQLLAWTPPPGAIYGPFVAYDASYVAPFFAMLASLPADP
ncbi:phosphate/phosphite/phosphonate ABC transporter substrate-binding protein [Pseudonocardia sp.]|jgi:phosphonate transport system substrate-binding protein|uniref:phosphate/phosphite/phosphonate ABC transporter substrate-binding protein n=1 Tax=Pseudonocardia sp. TaxID=60912 RepID=UPI003D0BAD86